MTVTYTIHKSTAGVIDAPAATSSLADSNTIRRGSRATITLRKPRLRLDIKDETFSIPTGDFEEFDVINIGPNAELVVDGTLAVGELTADGTLTLNGTLSLNERSALTLRRLDPYREFAGQSNISETLNGSQRFTETIDESVINTLVMGVEPDQQSRDNGIRGVWGVVDRISDDRNQPLTTSAITIELRILASYDEYNNIADVINNLKIN
jgi:hypothetical protein